MSNNPFLQPGSPGSASRSKTIVRQKYIARQPSQDYFEPDDDVQGDFSEFEGISLLFLKTLKVIIILS